MAVPSVYSIIVPQERVIATCYCIRNADKAIGKRGVSVVAQGWAIPYRNSSCDSPAWRSAESDAPQAVVPGRARTLTSGTSAPCFVVSVAPCVSVGSIELGRFESLVDECSVLARNHPNQTAEDVGSVPQHWE